MGARFRSMSHNGMCPCRYADVLVHRLLAASLGIASLPESARDGQALQRSAGNMNLRHRNAQMAGRASAELHTLIFFKARAIVTEARVFKVRFHPDSGNLC